MKNCKNLHKIYVLDKNYKPIFFTVNEIYQEGNLFFLWIKNMPFFLRKLLRRQGYKIVFKNTIVAIEKIFTIENKTVIVGGINE